MQSLPGGETRWQLYRLLSDPVRLRLLALAAEEELSVGELAELLGEAQPNVSRHAAPLRQAGLLCDRRQGTRTLVRLSDEAARDAVVTDALAAGRRMCEAEGSLARVADVVASRDEKTREFFAQPGDAEVGLSPELPLYLSAFAELIGDRALAVDAGTGDGVLLDLLAPVYRRVVAIDRSTAQLERARQRVRAHGYTNVTLIEDQIGGERVREAVGGGADLVLAVRVLHHAPRPKAALKDLAELARPGGKVLVIDYARHEDERMSEQQADVWLGFSEQELAGFAAAAKLEHVRVGRAPEGVPRVGVDAHLPCLTLLGTRPETVAGPRARRPPITD
ncbi:MAG: metalloregulator ArsR/SmtB family transcription factor [Polyangiaceae bacterium]|nr:metalloregulator ArsR/SmtB family transcription factor [Myxococcales bacterium]MCC6900862.1 metalloregulator ArsR/SmtB family transcription factor [Polyangiaceae bacterium]